MACKILCKRLIVINMQKTVQAKNGVLMKIFREGGATLKVYGLKAKMGQILLETLVL